MAPLRGWDPRGRRLDARVPHGHWKTPTFTAALRHDHVDAPCVIEEPVNRDLPAFSAVKRPNSFNATGYEPDRGASALHLNRP